ncbi:hypothetical protein [Caballeronia fortuita]|uniref:hypothetical protein n=1 Tax=Caballeronia fortuita TaxID=1777138 RepID=UPI000AAE318F|nr:hypothetical protein [Caballeronia fortuita]
MDLKMMNFVLGFFREYWPAVFASAFAWYGAPVMGKWLARMTEKLWPDDADEASK